MFFAGASSLLCKSLRSAPIFAFPAGHDVLTEYLSCSSASLQSLAGSLVAPDVFSAHDSFRRVPSTGYRRFTLSKFLAWHRAIYFTVIASMMRQFYFVLSCSSIYK